MSKLCKDTACASLHSRCNNTAPRIHWQISPHNMNNPRVIILGGRHELLRSPKPSKLPCITPRLDFVVDTMFCGNFPKAQPVSDNTSCSKHRKFSICFTKVFPQTTSHFESNLPQWYFWSLDASLSLSRIFHRSLTHPGAWWL